ncbi:MAG: helix-turn-helix domain-containing protein [Coriobacteriia bacterium]|nr:helix-turn-helix domain-containing protein [Coriobacteriia bacterium]
MPKDKGKKLNLDDRVTIAAGLDQGVSFAALARKLEVAPSTISREVLANRTDKGFRKNRNSNHCAHRDCFLKRVCGQKLCTDFCSECKKKNCNKYCEHFEEIVCLKLKKPPYVCNACKKHYSCSLRRFSYSARRADSKALRRRRDARSGIDGVPAKLDQLLTRL